MKSSPMTYLTRSLVLAAAGLLATSFSTFAQEIVSPSEFQRMSEGKTLYFSRGGRFYGAEQFYTRRRSLWQFADGECDEGEWFARQDFICFVYDQNPTPQCWQFLRLGPDSFAARAEGASEEFDILLDRVDESPLDCKGPATGV